MVKRLVLLHLTINQRDLIDDCIDDEYAIDLALVEEGYTVDTQIGIGVIE